MGKIRAEAVEQTDIGKLNFRRKSAKKRGRGCEITPSPALSNIHTHEAVISTREFLIYNKSGTFLYVKFPGNADDSMIFHHAQDQLYEKVRNGGRTRKKERLASLREQEKEDLCCYFLIVRGHLTQSQYRKKFQLNQVYAILIKIGGVS